MKNKTKQTKQTNEKQRGWGEVIGKGKGPEAKENEQIL